MLEIATIESILIRAVTTDGQHVLISPTDIRQFVITPHPYYIEISLSVGNLLPQPPVVERDVDAVQT